MAVAANESAVRSSQRRPNLDDEVFIVIGQNSNSTQEVVDNLKEILGYEATTLSVSNKASRIRKAGAALKEFERSGRGLTPEQRSERLNKVLGMASAARNKDKSLKELLDHVAKKMATK